MNNSVAQLFDECQKSFTVHKKCCAMMRRLKNDNEEEFRKAFLLCFDRILVVFKRGPTIERLVQFVIKFATNAEEEDGADDGFDVFLLEYLVQRANAKDKAVRFRVCQITAGLLKGLGDDAEISDEVWDDIVEKMVDRADDKVAAVRVQAVHALNRLQNPQDAEDHVTSLYVRLLNSDTCKDVRKAVLSNIGISKISLPEIIGRFRDVDKVCAKEVCAV
jgi:condensin complex subunit 3